MFPSRSLLAQEVQKKQRKEEQRAKRADLSLSSSSSSSSSSAPAAASTSDNHNDNGELKLSDRVITGIANEGADASILLLQECRALRSETQKLTKNIFKDFTGLKSRHPSWPTEYSDELTKFLYV